MSRGRWLGALLCVLTVCGVARAQELVKPKMMVVFDSSGSMTWTKTVNNQTCSWDECEDENSPGHSRLWAARKAIRSVVEETGDQALFSMMTFGHEKWPTTIAKIPDMCYITDYSDWYRFTWVDQAASLGYIWTGSQDTAHYVSHRLQTGMIWINSGFDRDLRQPFGGMKSSGLGREGGNLSREFFTETRFASFPLTPR